MTPKVSLLLLALVGSAAQAINQNAPILPDPLKTPGDVLTSDPNVICKPGYTKTVRNVPQQLKEEVYHSYGIYTRESGEYEIDHLISLELGGSNSARNLWPESFKTQPLNAHVKDDIENRLHELACAGKITFQQAQKAIATNWEEAYVKYIGPLPGGAQVQKHPNQPSIPVTHVPTLPRGSATPEMPTLNIPILPGLPGSSTNSPGNTTPTPPDITATPAEPNPTTPPDQTPDPTGSQAAAPNTDGSCPDAAPVKVSRAGIYHLPEGDPNYKQTKAVACYADVADAEAAGYRAPGSK